MSTGVSVLKLFGLSKLLWIVVFFTGILTLSLGLGLSKTSEQSMILLADTGNSGISNISSQGALVRSIAVVHSNALPIINETDKDSRDIRVEVLNEYMKQTNALLKTCGENCSGIAQDFSKYETTWNDIYQNKVLKNNNAEAFKETIEKLNPILESVFDKLDKLGAQVSKKVQDDQVAVIEKSNKTRKTLSWAVIISVIAVAISGIFFRKMIIKELHLMSSHLSSSAHVMKTQSEGLSTASKSLSQSTQQQALALGETSSSLDQLMGMVESNLKSTEQSLQFARSVRDMSAETDESLKDLNESMVDIKDANTKIEKLVHLIEEIADKTQLIDEIVFQTKLLSFNASVEAERAGEHGRGFAVVAQEVGNLAQMSGKSSGEISQIVKHAIDEARSVVVDNSSRVEKGSKLCDISVDKMKKVYEASNEIYSSSDQILRASREQDTEIKRIFKSVESLNQTTQKNTQNSEQSARSSSEMSNLSNDLNHQVKELYQLIQGRNAEVPTHSDLETIENESFQSSKSERQHSTQIFDEKPIRTRSNSRKASARRSRNQRKAS